MRKGHQKQTFQNILILSSVLLMTLPFVVVFNDVITRWFEGLPLYRLLEQYIVPLEARVVGVILRPLGFSYVAYLDGMKVNGMSIGISWNCLGWQSLVLFFITLWGGLRGNFRFLSKVETVAIGLLGLFFVNIFRLSAATVLAVVYRPLFVIVFHDYLAAALTVLWLLVFWWFSYAYVLEEKHGESISRRQESE